MKLIALLVTSSILFFGCSSEQKWEYKVIKVYPDNSYDRTGADALRYHTIAPSESELSKLGYKGWELVTSYLEMETSYPNFGNEDYHTGIKTNVRPQSLVLLFKRPWTGEFDKVVEKN